jgi:squalene-hopene/tetraprenyl-beta-curcumene cyclase
VPDGKLERGDALAMSSSPVTEDLFASDQEMPASSRLGKALAAAKSHLLSLQKEDGHWCGELEGDTIVESEYLLTLHLLGRGQETRARKAAEYIRQQQLPGGGWAVYPGGPPEVSASVKAYFVLKLMGDAPEESHMARARDVILSLGGIDACNSFTKIYLSIFGQCEWEKCPAVPPELILLPEWFPFNIYRMSSWSRAIVVPLSIIWAVKPSFPVPESVPIDELRARDRGVVPRVAGPLQKRAWASFFRGLDDVLKVIERANLVPLRKKALARAEAWILEHLEGSDGLGAILPPIINTIIALRCLDYALDDPTLLGQVGELEKLEIEDEDTLRIQPCFSAVWDTALAIQALLETNVPPSHPALQRAARWLVEKECQREGDFKRRNPGAEPGGWCFEYRNEFYPDSDDTAAVLTALSRVRLTDPALEQRRQGALERGLNWQLLMQNADGGWGAFDKGCDNEVFTYIPFADHNAMIDPSCEDITGRSLEAFRHMGLPREHSALRRGVAFLKSRQGPDGTWYGRWGCNYIYGTWLALRGLELAGEDLSAYRCSAAWFYRHQNEDGGWGELPRSYDDPREKGIGPSTASQTAWALMGLFALGDVDTAGVKRGLGYLLRTQRSDGSWKDDWWTGTGFPKVFYLRYHLYAVYFPLLAMGILEKLLSGGVSEPVSEVDA